MIQLPTDSNQWHNYFEKQIPLQMEKDPLALLDLLVKAVDEGQFEKFIQKQHKNYKNIFDCAEAIYCPKVINRSFWHSLSKEWKEVRHFVHNFIPIAVTVILGAFNFFNFYQNATTLFEKQVLVDIYYKLFKMPEILIKHLEPVFGTSTKVYFVATLVIFTSVAILRTYYKWLNPIPTQIIYCERMKGENKIGKVSGEFKQLTSWLSMDKNILLVGLSGSGKTALMNQYVKLEKKVVFKVNCGAIASKSFAQSEALTELRNQTKGYEGEIILYFDEFSLLASNPSALGAFKTHFIKNEGIQFVCALSTTHFEEISKKDDDGSLLREFKKVEINDPGEEAFKVIAKDLSFKHSILVNDEAVKKLSQLSLKKEFMPIVGLPAKAEALLEEAICQCKEAYKYRSNEEIAKIEKIVASHFILLEEYYKITRSIQLKRKISSTSKIKYLFLHFYFLDASKKYCYEKMKTQENSYVSLDLIQQAFEKMKNEKSD